MFRFTLLCLFYWFYWCELIFFGVISGALLAFGLLFFVFGFSVWCLHFVLDIVWLLVSVFVFLMIAGFTYGLLYAWVLRYWFVWFV